MKTILVSFAVVSIVAITACSAPAAGEDDVTSQAQTSAAPGIWQLARQCGTKETGACVKDLTSCDGAAIGDACALGGSKCLGEPIESGLRSVLFCNPTDSGTWTYNGDCSGNCGNKPACDDNDKQGDRCHYPLKRCAKNGRVLVCLTNGKDQFVFAGYCGKNGGPACANVPACALDEDGMAGLACDAVGTTCHGKVDNQVGKIFTCASR